MPPWLERLATRDLPEQSSRSLRVLERLGYTVDTSVDPLFNETRKGGRVFAGAPVAPYFPDPEDVCRAGGSRVLEVPISSATDPALPKSLEAVYTRMPPLPYRGWLKRLGLRAVWLRPSYTPLERMKALAARLTARGVGCLNVIFHSSEVLPGGSPYNRDEASVTRFLDELQLIAVEEHSRAKGAQQFDLIFEGVFGEEDLHEGTYVLQETRSRRAYAMHVQDRETPRSYRATFSLLT